ncbi:MAG: hypothetical protein WCA12_20090 [Burkholderiales bacterium]
MNQPNSPQQEHAPGTAPSKSSLLRIIFVAAILLAAGLATIPLERGGTAPAVGEHLVAPALSMIASPIAGTSVPAASEVFAGREVATELAPPTF